MCVCIQEGRRGKEREGERRRGKEREREGGRKTLWACPYMPCAGQCATSGSVPQKSFMFFWE